ncbi:MAG: EFR1 family ferrodoxin [Oscillospiraceae bacterium]|nr:EFR1 family ferrodoxin [Oscillospiraceae bacterium]
MTVNTVYAVYFSATGNTRRVASLLANAVAQALEVPMETVDFTLPAAREENYSFAEGDLVVFATPTYAGKLPNKLLPYIQSGFAGNGALAVPVVTFGNRSYDNSLAELTATLEANGFHTIAAGAFAAQHAFSTTLAAGRPDADDLRKVGELGAAVVGKVVRMTQIPVPVVVKGDAAAPYYVPKGLDGEPKVFLKAKPKTDLERCIGCGVCANLCPMGSISRENVADVTGVCIKCHSCVKNCPMGAKFFDDEAFLSHKAMLERDFMRRAEAEIFT